MRLKHSQSNQRAVAMPQAGGLKRIALLICQEDGYGRGILRGVQAFAATRNRWIFRNAPPSLELVAGMPEWEPDGIIAQLASRELVSALTDLDKPMVNVASGSAADEVQDVPLVETDQIAIGVTAANHFLENGFRHFAYFGTRRVTGSSGREQGFRDRLAERGFQCSSNYTPSRPVMASTWKEADPALCRWLHALPKPVAIFAGSDNAGRELAEVCRLIDLRVPEQVALLGVGDDRVECGMSVPPLSSIALPSERVGFEAARMLAHLMAGDPLDAPHLQLPPKGVVGRQSSDLVAVVDEHVSHALRYIRENATKPIDVHDVLREVPVSRRKLEQKFRQHIDRTIFAEIRRLRIEKAQHLLATTNLSMPAVALRSGFESARRLAVIFGRVAGMTPTAYRAAYRLK